MDKWKKTTKMLMAMAIYFASATLIAVFAASNEVAMGGAVMGALGVLPATIYMLALFDL